MKKELQLFLVHYNMPELGKAWCRFFDNQPNVNVVEADIFDINVDAIVSPGNSFGFMDGGLDLLISKRMGWAIQTELKKRINASPLRELLVGQTETIATNNQLVICAPTMRVPGSDGIPESVNAYLAMKAILIEGLANNNITSIAIPGLCTGTGKMSPFVAAKQMFAAYSEVILNQKLEFPLYIDAIKQQRYLKRNTPEYE